MPVTMLWKSQQRQICLLPRNCFGTVAPPSRCHSQLLQCLALQEQRQLSTELILTIPRLAGLLSTVNEALWCRPHSTAIA